VNVDMDYISRCHKCQKVNQAIANDMNCDYLAKRIAEIIKDGMHVERLSGDEIRKPENWCNCHRDSQAYLPMESTQ
jgi:hypothetical protein